jgi:hypothetical protein
MILARIRLRRMANKEALVAGEEKEQVNIYRWR